MGKSIAVVREQRQALDRKIILGLDVVPTDSLRYKRLTLEGISLSEAP